MIKKVENTFPWAYIISDPNVENTVGRFYEKELQKKSRSGQSWKSNQEKK